MTERPNHQTTHGMARNRRDRFVHAAPTVEDVARHAGVSRQTVSNVLNEPDRVRPETIDRVRLSIDALGYRANRNARNLRTRQSRAIAYRIPPVVGHLNSVMDSFLHELTEAVENIGCHVLLFASANEVAEVATYWELSAQSAADGIVIAGTQYNDPRPAALQKHGVPFVSFGRSWSDVEHSWVDVDGRAGTRLAIEHLLAQGHRRFAWLGTTAGSPTNAEREHGVRETLAAAGIPAADLHMLQLIDEVSSDRNAIDQVLSREGAPTAFVSVSDLQALTVLTELESRGLVPGRDASVIGFDDSPVAAYAGGGLTTVRQPITKVANEIARLLNAQLDDPSTPAEGVLLTPELIVRRTG